MKHIVASAFAIAFIVWIVLVAIWGLIFPLKVYAASLIGIMCIYLIGMLIGCVKDLRDWDKWRTQK